MLKHGKTEAKILANLIRSGKKLPDWAQEAPELLIGLDFTFNAFFDLSGDRNGSGPIPYQSLVWYAEHHGLEGEDVDDFVEHLRAMDREFLAYNEEQLEIARKGHKPKE